MVAIVVTTIGNIAEVKAISADVNIRALKTSIADVVRSLTA